MTTSTATQYDYVTVGHVTCDELPDGTRRPGGTAFYSALQAARLGLRALVVTQGRAQQIEALLAPWRGELDVSVTDAERTTTLVTRGSGTSRRQRLLAWAGEMVDPPLPAAGVLHLAPVACELSKRDGSDDFVITPQGLLRRWPGRAGEVRLAELHAALLPSRFSAAVLSEQELPYCAPLLAAARGCHACVAVTAGPRAATLQLGDGRTVTGPAPAAVRVRDDLGAGDVFAAAFFVALREGREALAAARFANAAAAIRVGADGPDAVGARAAIEALLD